MTEMAFGADLQAGFRVGAVMQVLPLDSSPPVLRALSLLPTRALLIAYWGRPARCCS